MQPNERARVQPDSVSVQLVMYNVNAEDGSALFRLYDGVGYHLESALPSSVTLYMTSTLIGARICGFSLAIDVHFHFLPLLQRFFFFWGGVVLWKITLNFCTMNHFSVDTCDIKPRPSSFLVCLMIQGPSYPAFVKGFHLHYGHFFVHSSMT